MSLSHENKWMLKQKNSMTGFKRRKNTKHWHLPHSMLTPKQQTHKLNLNNWGGKYWKW